MTIWRSLGLVTKLYMWLTCPCHPAVKEMWLTTMHNTYLAWALLRMHSFQTRWTMWLWSFGGIFLDLFGLCIATAPPSWDPRWPVALCTLPLSPGKQAQLEHEMSQVQEVHRLLDTVPAKLTCMKLSSSLPQQQHYLQGLRESSPHLFPIHQPIPTCLGLWDSLCVP